MKHPQNTSTRFRRKVLWVLSGILILLFAPSCVRMVKNWVINSMCGAVICAPNFPRQPEFPQMTQSVMTRVCGDEYRLIWSGQDQRRLSAQVVIPRCCRKSVQTVVLLHGIRDKSDSNRAWGMRLAAQGYRVILPDIRGHGLSQGRFLTYGVRERENCRRMLDAAGQNGIPTQNCSVAGQSYGGALALQWAAIDTRIGSIASVSAFTCLRDVVQSYKKCYFRGFEWMIPSSWVQIAVERGGERAGFDPDQASPLLAAARIRRPVLLIHGADDRHIPVGSAWQLCFAIQAPKQLLIVPGAGHYDVDRPGFPMESRIQAWFERWR